MQTLNTSLKTTSNGVCTRRTMSIDFDSFLEGMEHFGDIQNTGRRIPDDYEQRMKDVEELNAYAGKLNKETVDVLGTKHLVQTPLIPGEDFHRKMAWRRRQFPEWDTLSIEEKIERNHIEESEPKMAMLTGTVSFYARDLFKEDIHKRMKPHFHMVMSRNKVPEFEEADCGWRREKIMALSGSDSFYSRRASDRHYTDRPSRFALVCRGPLSEIAWILLKRYLYGEDTKFQEYLRDKVLGRPGQYDL